MVAVVALWKIPETEDRWHKHIPAEQSFKDRFQPSEHFKALLCPLGTQVRILFIHCSFYIGLPFYGGVNSVWMYAVGLFQLRCWAHLTVWSYIVTLLGTLLLCYPGHLLLPAWLIPITPHVAGWAGSFITLSLLSSSFLPWALGFPCFLVVQVLYKLFSGVLSLLDGFEF